MYSLTAARSAATSSLGIAELPLGAVRAEQTRLIPVVEVGAPPLRLVEPWPAAPSTRGRVGRRRVAELAARLFATRHRRPPPPACARHAPAPTVPFAHRPGQPMR